VRDSGSIVVGWLGKVVLVLGLLGLVAFDGFALVVANFNASDHASMAAREAADTFRRNRGDLQGAYDAALAVVDEDDEIETDTFTLDERGTVQLYVKREAKTLWMHHIGPLRKFTHVRHGATGKPFV